MDGSPQPKAPRLSVDGDAEPPTQQRLSASPRRTALELTAHGQPSAGGHTNHHHPTNRHPRPANSLSRRPPAPPSLSPPAVTSVAWPSDAGHPGHAGSSAINRWQQPFPVMAIASARPSQSQQRSSSSRRAETSRGPPPAPPNDYAACPKLGSVNTPWGYSGAVRHHGSRRQGQQPSRRAAPFDGSRDASHHRPPSPAAKNNGHTPHLSSHARIGKARSRNRKCREARKVAEPTAQSAMNATDALSSLPPAATTAKARRHGQSSSDSLPSPGGSHRSSRLSGDLQSVFQANVPYDIDTDILGCGSDDISTPTVTPAVFTTSQFQRNLAQAMLNRDADRVGALLKLYRRLLDSQHDGRSEGDAAAATTQGNVLLAGTTQTAVCVTPPPELVEQSRATRCILLQADDNGLSSEGILDEVLDGESGYTLMHVAILTKRRSIVKTCLRFGTKVHAVEDAQGDTPLTLAMRRFPSVVPVLFSLGKSIDVRRGRDGRRHPSLSVNSRQNLLHYAVAADHRTPRWSGRLNFLQCLVNQFGVDPTQEDAYGFTPLLWAREHEQWLGRTETTSIVTFLRKAAAKVRRRRQSAFAREGGLPRRRHSCGTPARVTTPEDDITSDDVHVDLLYELTGLTSAVVHRRAPSPPPLRPLTPIAAVRRCPSPLPRPPTSMSRSPLPLPGSPEAAAWTVREHPCSLDRHHRSQQPRSATASRAPPVGFSVSPSPRPLTMSVSASLRRPPAAPLAPEGSTGASASQRRAYCVHFPTGGSVSQLRTVSVAAAASRFASVQRAVSQSVATALRGLEEEEPTCPAAVPRMTLNTTLTDTRMLAWRGPRARLLAVLLLLLLHCVSYAIDTSTSWYGEVRFDLWWLAVNMVGAGWAGSAFVMGLLHVLCCVAGVALGYLVAVYGVGEGLGIIALHLPIFGAQSTAERRFLRKELGVYHEAFYRVTRRPRVFLAPVGVLCGLALSASVYNALVETWWGGQADWAKVQPVLRGVTPPRCLLLLWGLTLACDWLLLCALVDVMYQMGSLAIYLPHYTYGSLADAVDLRVRPLCEQWGLLYPVQVRVRAPKFLDQYSSCYGRDGSATTHTSPQSPLITTVDDSPSPARPRVDDGADHTAVMVAGTRTPPAVRVRRTVSLQRFRLWAFWFGVLMGWLVIVVVLSIVLCQSPRMAPEAVTIPARGALDEPPTAQAILCALFSSGAVAVEVGVGLQAWTWPTFQSHPYIALPGTTVRGCSIHLGWVLWLLLFVIGSMDVRLLVENCKVAMGRGPSAAVVVGMVVALLPAGTFLVALVGLLVLTSLRLVPHTISGPSAVVASGEEQVERPILRAWLSGRHMYFKAVPSAFSLLRSAAPQLPQWQVLEQHPKKDERRMEAGDPLQPLSTASTRRNDGAGEDTEHRDVPIQDAPTVAVVELVEYMEQHRMLHDSLFGSQMNPSTEAVPHGGSLSPAGHTRSTASALSPMHTTAVAVEEDPQAAAIRRARLTLRTRAADRRQCAAYYRKKILACVGATTAARRRRFEARQREGKYAAWIATAH